MSRIICFITSDYIEQSNKEGKIAAIIGTGAFNNYFNVMGMIGIIGFSHLNGNNREVNAYIAYPRMVFD